MELLGGAANQQILNDLGHGGAVARLDAALVDASLFGLEATLAAKLLSTTTRLLLDAGFEPDSALAGSKHDRRLRSRLRGRALAGAVLASVEGALIRSARLPLGQSLILAAVRIAVFRN